MINVQLLQNNTIVTLEIQGKKTTIKSSAGLYHPNPKELLCTSLGACIGKHIVKYCSHEKINVESFEQINIDINNNEFIININYPKGLSLQNIIDLKQIILNCDIAKLLKTNININFNLNKKAQSNTKKSTSCCGG